MSVHTLDCGCYFDANNHRHWCPSCLDPVLRLDGTSPLIEEARWLLLHVQTRMDDSNMGPWWHRRDEFLKKTGGVA